MPFPDLTKHSDYDKYDFDYEVIAKEECPKCGTINPVYRDQNCITCKKCGHEIWIK